MIDKSLARLAKVERRSQLTKLEIKGRHYKSYCINAQNHKSILSDFILYLKTKRNGASLDVQILAKLNQDKINNFKKRTTNEVETETYNLPTKKSPGLDGICENLFIVQQHTWMKFFTIIKLQKPIKIERFGFL